MSSFLKKALNIFVERDNSHNQNHMEKGFPAEKSASTELSQKKGHVFNDSEIEKYESHFERVFEKANLPGPDYYEFCKMMETLKSHIPDEKARIEATFASLSIRGLTKEKLIDTAAKYIELIRHDKSDFERIVGEKSETDIGLRRKNILALEDSIAKKAEMIQKLTREIAESQHAISKLRNEISLEEKKVTTGKDGYYLACEAIVGKIIEDIQKIQSTL